MNTEALFLFLILLLGLVLCSFLGGNCKYEGFSGSSQNNENYNKKYNNGASTSSNVNYDNYNHYDGSSTQLVGGTSFYGPNGGSVTINTNSDGTQSLEVTLKQGENPMTFTSTNETSNNNVESYTNYYGDNGRAATFYGPNGATATLITKDGQPAINVQTSSGSYTYTQSGTYYNPNNTSSTKYYGSTGYHVQQNNLAYQGPYGVSAGSVTGPYGNTAYYAEGPYGNTVAGTTNNNDYYNSLPPGIPASQIPNGEEDLYILKSQVVPPVCPVCPVNTVDRETPCPACPPCGRCPEPSFECKKVPNYNAINSSYLPQPILNDFSTFGM